jgi:hypothetical protein
MGLWSEESVEMAWGLDVGHLFESVMSRTLGGRVMWEVSRLVWVIEAGILVDAI